MKNKIKTIILLFITFLKIGLFTFGGGYAMIPLIQRETVDKKKWITHKLFLDIIAISESTPGPFAVNSATYIGYTVAGFFGSLFSTLGVVLPSFIIIFIISQVFDLFLDIEWVKYAFSGIQVCVAFLILSAGIKMLKTIKVTFFNYFMCLATMVLLILLTIFSINFSTIFIILIGGVIGIVIYLISYISLKHKNKENKK